MTEAATSLEWRPVAVLPALRMAMTIEAGHTALVPSSEPRVSAIKDAHPVFRTFLGRFTDAFRVRIHPAVLLVHAKTPRTFLSSGSLASLRDAIAVSTVSYGQALEIIYPRGHRIGFADAFAFHPWMVDRQFEGLIAITQAMQAVHEVERFQGQPAPGVPGADLREGDVDRPLLDALLQRWRDRFSARTPAWADVALFRSLNMAHQACLMPSAAADSTLYDVGRQIALWVSAFEILVHPGPGGQAILAVPKGQTEAAAALGLTRGHVLRLVVLPQALRTVIPPVTSQYLSLTKNSSLAVAIGYPDLVRVSQVTISETGRAVECVTILLVVYLSLSLATAALMDRYNRRIVRRGGAA